MSPTSFQTAPPRVINFNGWRRIRTALVVSNRFTYSFHNGWRRIRTFEGGANRFTVCPLWPLGNPSIKPINGLEPLTCWLQISCSANWAISAYLENGTNRARTCDPLLVRQVLSQLSYDPKLLKRPRRDSNPRPPPWQGGALTNWATGPYLRNVPSKPNTSF